MALLSKNSFQPIAKLAPLGTAPCTGLPHCPAASLRPLPARRRYATHNSLGGSKASSRRQVTVVGDDGRVRWGDLSKREKAARTTQQSFNLLTILVGALGTGAVIVFLYREVFSPESSTNQFNRAVDRVKRDPRCIELLGSSKKIIAYGEPTSNKWAMARPIAHTTTKDRGGSENLLMHFNVEGPLNKGVVNLQMVKRPGQDEFDYKYLALDVEGHQRIYLENAEATAEGRKSSGKLFGVRWW